MPAIKNVKLLWVQNQAPYKIMTLVKFAEGVGPDGVKGYLSKNEVEVSY